MSLDALKDIMKAIEDSKKKSSDEEIKFPEPLTYDGVKLINPKYNGYKYCPYCGAKIDN